jgi:hypothetical protein
MKVSCTKAEFPKELESINPVIGRATNTRNDDTIQNSNYYFHAQNGDDGESVT